MKALQLENDILKLKMLAESGAEFGEFNELPPDLEHIFLQHVMSFEEAWRNAKEVTVFELIGRPVFKKEFELSDQEMEEELERLIALMARHHFIFRGIEGHPPRDIYQMITEEIFLQETRDMHLPGMTTHISYEGKEEE